MDRDNDTLHTFIVDKITDMTSDAMKPFFEMSTEIHEALHRLVQGHYKRDATGEEYFRFLTSNRPNNNNVAVTFGAACRQCLRSDSPSGRFIWVYPPEEYIRHVSDLVCFTLEDRPDNNSSTRLLPSFLRISVEPSSSTNNLVLDRKSTRLNSSHWLQSRMPSSA